MDDFYAARNRTIPPLPWSNFAPPQSLEQAVALLVAFADMPVKFVALRGGYANASAFPRAFRTHRESPRAYRALFQR